MRPRQTVERLKGRFDNWRRDLERQQRIEEAELRHAASQIFDPNARLPPELRSIKPLDPKKVEAMHAGDERAASEYSPVLSSQAELERDAWERAIGALPAAMRQMVEEARDALSVAEQALADKQARLAAMRPDDELWASRHSQLTSAIDALEDQVGELAAAYRRTVRMAADRMGDRLWEWEADKEAAHAAAKERYQSLLAESRAELGRLANERTALGRVRAAVQDLIQVEQHFGRVVTEKPDPQAERKARRAYREQALLHLGRGRG